MMLPNGEREGGAREGRSLFLAVPTKGWWWPTEDWVKFGRMQRAELQLRSCVYSPNSSQLGMLTLPRSTAFDLLLKCRYPGE